MDTEDSTRTFSFRVEKAELAKWSDSAVEQVGEMISDAVRRARNEAICERDGHEKSRTFELIGVCDRCHLVIDSEKYAAMKEVPV